MAAGGKDIGEGNDQMDTYAQRSVKHCLNMLAPFEASDRQSEKGQLEFYQLMVSIYQGMYESPEEYLVFPSPYEEYLTKLQKGTPQKKKEKEHISDSQESTLRNTFQQAIQFYALYFYNLGLKSKSLDERTGSLVVLKEDYKYVLKQMERIHDAKYNVQRYERLVRLGIQTEEKNDTVYVSHKVNKNAMSGLQYLCMAPDSKYKWMNFLRLDYKNAFAPIPTVADICKTLSSDNAEIVKKLEDSLAGMGIKVRIKPLRGIVSDFKWKVEYSLKGKNICGFYADHEYLMLCIYFNHFQNITEFSRTLYEEDSKLFQWFKAQFPERLCKCPNNRRVYFGEEPRRICGLSNRAEIVNPDSEDVERTLYIMRRYRNMKGKTEKE